MGFTVPGYRVDRLLGVGGQAEVWLGHELATGDAVALKRVSVDAPEAAAAARAEAALLAALDHPNLIRLRAYLPIRTALVLVLELAEAGSLAGLLDRRHRLTPPEVVATVCPVATALVHAHEAGLLHGDVSAANILFDRDGRPKLADLGMARMLAALAPARYREDEPSGAGDRLAGDRLAGTVDQPFGTPAYLDPTIAAGGPAGTASDVFSLGAVAFHALTGTGPWHVPGEPAPSAEQALGLAAAGTIPALADRLREVPPAMVEVLVRALDSEPHRRGTAAELALDLRAALPPSLVQLSGGRIARPMAAGQSPGVGTGQRAGVGTGQSAGLEFVPTDLTRIPARRPPADVAAMLRAGGVMPSEVARQTRRGSLRAFGSARRLTAAAVRSVPGVARWAPGVARWTSGVLRSVRAAVGTKRDPAGRRIRRGSVARVVGHDIGPRPGGRHRAAETAGRADRGSPSLAVLTMLVVAALVVAGVLGWSRLHRRPAESNRLAASQSRPAGTQSRPSVGASSAPAEPARDRATATSGREAESDAARDGAGWAAAADPVPVADLAGILAGLDAVRERAYRERRPELLAGLYASPALLAADTRQLERSVPTGCQLVGVRTSYRDLAIVRPSPQPSSRTVSATATAVLPAATLSCRGTVRSRTEPAGPVRLRLVLSDAGQGWRIAGERLDTP